MTAQITRRAEMLPVSFVSEWVVADSETIARQQRNRSYGRAIVRSLPSSRKLRTSAPDTRYCPQIELRG